MYDDNLCKNDTEATFHNSVANYWVICANAAGHSVVPYLLIILLFRFCMYSIIHRLIIRVQ
jgi:hypothetical protein